MDLKVLEVVLLVSHQSHGAFLFLKALASRALEIRDEFNPLEFASTVFAYALLKLRRDDELGSFFGIQLFANHRIPLYPRAPWDVFFR